MRHHRSRGARSAIDSARKADLKQLRSHVRATRALNRDQKRSAALGKADEVNASGTTQRRNAQAAAAVLASLGVERGLDDLVRTVGERSNRRWTTIRFEGALIPSIGR